MKGALARLKKLALRPLWVESAAFRARRRFRTLVTMPFALLGGVAWGWFAAPAMSEGSPLFWSSVGAFTFGLFIYLEQKLVPVVAALADRIGVGALSILLWEGGVVGGLAYLLTGVMQAPIVPAVAMAVGAGTLYAVAMEYALGPGARHVVSLLGAGTGGSTPRDLEYSQAESMAVRGQAADAADVYLKAIETNPRDGTPYIRLARILSQTGDYEQAILTLRTAFQRARLGADQEAFLVRQIHEICLAKLGDESRSIDDLRRLLERQREGKHAEWARRQLSEIKRGRARD